MYPSIVSEFWVPSYLFLYAQLLLNQTAETELGWTIKIYKAIERMIAERKKRVFLLAELASFF